MELHTNSVDVPNGAALTAATITVTDSTGAVATIYDTTGAAKANPFTSDARTGMYSFKAANGTYTVSIAKTGIEATSYKVTLFDPADNDGTNGNLSDALQLADYAALRAYAGNRKSVYITGYSASAAPSGIAGMFVRDDADTTSADNGGTVIVAANGKRWKRRYDGAVDVRWFGAKCDGVTDDTAALVAADAASVALGHPIAISGTVLIKSALTFSGKSHWKFEGASGTLAGETPKSYLIKHASIANDFLTFTGPAVLLDGVAVVGQEGNGGDGLVFWGHSPQVLRPFVTKMGRDGIRIGRDSGTSNVNCFFITNPRCLSNGRHGININDKPAGAPDANAGSIINPTCNSNGGHGIYGGNAYLGVTIITPTCETNAGWGIYLDTLFRQNVIVGGDLEVNTTGNLYQAVAYANTIIGTAVQGKTIHNRAQISSYVPTITGSTTAGICTYASQEGEFEISGASVHFSAHISYSGHTGAGQPYISLPAAIYASTPNMQYSPVEVVSSGLALAAGARVVGLVNRDGGRLQLYTNNAGALAPLNLPASGEFYIRGTYPLNTPNYFAV